MLSSTDGPVQNNLIEGNFIGTNFDGSAAVPNNGDGVQLREPFTSNNTLRNNVISGNQGNGVVVHEGSQNAILANRIGANAAGNHDK